MRNGRFIIVEGAGGWTVREDDNAVVEMKTLNEALAMAKILAYAVKAVGGKAAVFVEDATGQMTVYDLDRG